jgi:hypothetical protein
LTASFQNPVALPNALTFQVQVWLPNQLRVNPSYWQFITMGGGIPGYGAPGQISATTPCNNLNAFNYSVPPPAYLSITDPVGEQLYFNNFVNKYHTLSFPIANVSYGLPLYSILGNLTVANNSVPFDTSVSLDSTNNWVIHQLSFSMNQMVQYCNSLGVTEVYSSTNRYYTLPIAVIQRDSNNNFLQTATNFYVQVTSSGTIGSVTSSSQYQPTLFRTELTTVTSTCPATQALLNTVYLLEILNVYNSSVFVGPRNISDIVWTSPQLPYNNTLQNCYQESVTGLVHLGCSNSICYTQITTQTHCRVVTPDGNAFNNCSAALPADRINDVGNGAYPLALNGVHTFFSYDYQCPLTANQANQWLGCVLVVYSPYNYPDVLTATLSIQVYPETVLQVSFDVYAGLLSSPYITDLTQIETLSQGPNNVVVTQDLYNTQLQWNGIFTYVIGILDPTLRSTSNLTMTVNTLFTIYPTDINGNIVNNGQVLYIAQVFPYMIYVPKQMLGTCRVQIPYCTNTPATANQTAYDSFSISVITLRTLLPANGYSVTTSYQISAPQAINAIGYNTGGSQTLQAKKHVYMSKSKRSMRLKSSVDTSGVTLSNTLVGVSNFTFLINDQTNPSPPPQIVIGPNVNVTYAETNASAIVTGYQVALRLFVDSSSDIADPTNATQLIDYGLSHIATPIGTTLGININQVINIQVSMSPPMNSLAVKPRPKRKLLSQEGVALYITIVLIPSPLLPNVTAYSLAQQLINPNNLPTLTANLLIAHLVFDASYTMQTVVAYVSATYWYSNPTPTPTIAVYYDHHDNNNDNGAFAGVLALIVFLLGVGCLVSLVYAPDCCWGPIVEPVPLMLVDNRPKKKQQYFYYSLDPNQQVQEQPLQQQQPQPQLQANTQKHQRSASASSPEPVNLNSPSPENASTQGGVTISRRWKRGKE